MSTIDSGASRCVDEGALQTPVPIDNAPGLSAIAYRVGTYAQFKQSMLARLSDPDLPGLQTLTTRQENDFTIALLDSWSMVADVLTFYQERIANESYRRTATESFSLRELSRMVNYRLQPGVAANAYLAFTLEDSPGAPAATFIDVGNKVQSLPDPGQTPQIFETVESIEARATWNAMSTMQNTLTPPLYLETTTLLLQAGSPSLQPGDALLFVGEIAGEMRTLLRQVQKADVDPNTRQVLLMLVPVPPSVSPAAAATTASVPVAVPATKSYRDALTEPFLPLDDITVNTYHLHDQVQQKDLEALALVQGWNLATLQTHLAHTATAQKSPFLSLQAEPAWHELSNPQIFALRTHAALFGNAVPDWKLLPTVAQKPFVDAYKKAFPTENFDESDWPFFNTTPLVDLDRLYPQVVRDDWCAAFWPDVKEPVIARIAEVKEVSVARFAASNRVTEIVLAAGKNQKAAPATMQDVRRTTILLQSEELFLARVPDLTPITGQTITVNGRYDGLQAGRKLVVAGTRSDLQGVESNELVILHAATIQENSNQTVLTLEAPGLLYSYLPGSVSVNANVALATQGESIMGEILGSGDGSQPYQRFTLRQSPLTYVQANTATGSTSTLQVAVDGVPWQEVPALFNRGPLDHAFTTMINDDQTVTVQFGDGQTTGARLPTGNDNIQASYRKGIGQQALVASGQLSLLMTHPLGVKSVTNPQPATGAVDPDTVDDARREADSLVLTMDRIVSRRDYEESARAIVGVAKVQASVVWMYDRKRVIVTVAGTPTPTAPCGVQITADSGLYGKIYRKLRQASDPGVSFTLQSYRIALFRLGIALKTFSVVPTDQVLKNIEQRVQNHFAFAMRQFAQPVSLREVMTVVQSIDGVASVTITSFYRVDAPPLSTDPPPSPDAQLLAAAFSMQPDGEIELAELLLLDPEYPFDRLEVLDEL